MSNEVNPSEKPKKPFWKKWPFIVLECFIALIFTVWIGGWFFIASQIKSAIEDSFVEFSQQGQDLACADLRTSGFPFRMHVTCETLSISAIGQPILTIQELRGKVSIFNPTQFFLEVDSPLTADLPDLNLPATVTGNWDLIRANTNFSNFGFSVRINSAKFLIGDVFEILNLGEFETSGGLQGDANSHGYTFNLKVRDLLPNLIGIDAEQSGKIDIGIHVPIGEEIIDGPSEKLIEGYLKQGGEVQIKEVNLAMGGVELDLSGEMNFSENGLLFGKLSLWIANYEKLVLILGSNLPDYTEMINTLLPTIISGFPTQDKDGISGREIPIKIVNGAVKIGVFPAGNIPPLSLEQHN